MNSIAAFVFVLESLGPGTTPAAPGEMILLDPRPGSAWQRSRCFIAKSNYLQYGFAGEYPISAVNAATTLGKQKSDATNLP